MNECPGHVVNRSWTRWCLNFCQVPESVVLEEPSRQHSDFRRVPGGLLHASCLHRRREGGPQAVVTLPPLQREADVLSSLKETGLHPLPSLVDPAGFEACGAQTESALMLLSLKVMKHCRSHQQFADKLPAP